MMNSGFPLERPAMRGGPKGLPFLFPRGFSMDDKQDGLALSVTIPAADLSRLQRRVAYLEAVLIQVMREKKRIKEWFSAAELVALRLPGLPTTKGATTRHARAEGWAARAVPCQGGQRHEYHFSSLPRRAFDALIAMVVAPLAGAAPFDQVAQVPDLPKAIPPPPRPQNASPPWLLPLMRMMRQQGTPNVSDAIRELPAYLPAGIACPTEGEAREVLRALGMVG
jgi:Mu DNA-binding domain